MSDAARPRFWQIHLSTILLMTIVYATLLALELTFNEHIEEWFARLVHADAITASDANPFSIALMPMYLIADAVVAIACGVTAEIVTRRRERRA